MTSFAFPDGKLVFLEELLSVPLYTTMGTNWLPAAVMESATVARLVLIVEVLITMVFLPRISSVFWGYIKKYWLLVHVDDPV